MSSPCASVSASRAAGPGAFGAHRPKAPRRWVRAKAARSWLLGWLALLPLLPLLPATAAERSIDKTAVLAATLPQAWEAWTTREGIRSFFAPDAVIEPRVGGLFEIQFDPGAAPGLRGADGMRFMALQPMQMLSFEWNAPPSLPEVRGQRTLVVLRFEPVDAAHTRVTLHHTGWGQGGQWDQAYSYFDRAWGNVLGNLHKRFETGPVDWTTWLQQLEAARQRAAQPISAASSPR